MASSERDVESGGWTVETVRTHLQRQIDDLRSMLQERFEMQTKIADERFSIQTKSLEERYDTQTKAVDAAFVSQQTATRTALVAAEQAVTTAMLAAEKAVTKAETAAERRFESLNEFRGQLSDQAATFVSRKEMDALQLRNDDKWAELNSRISEARNTMTLVEGKGAGLSAGWAILVGVVSVVAALVAIGVAVLR